MEDERGASGPVGEERELEGNVAQARQSRTERRAKWKAEKLDSVKAEEFGVYEFVLIWNEVMPKKYRVEQLSHRGQVAYESNVKGMLSRMDDVSEMTDFVTWLKEHWPKTKRHHATLWIHKKFWNYYNYPSIIAVLRYWDSYIAAWVDCTSTEEQYSDHYALEAARDRLEATHQKVDEQLRLAHQVDVLRARNVQLTKRIEALEAVDRLQKKMLNDLYTRHPEEDPLNDPDE
jgi:hypothetical protein